jgi:hypothetical protein
LISTAATTAFETASNKILHNLPHDLPIWPHPPLIRSFPMFVPIMFSFEAGPQAPFLPSDV